MSASEETTLVAREPDLQQALLLAAFRAEVDHQPHRRGRDVRGLDQAVEAWAQLQRVLAQQTGDFVLEQQIVREGRVGGSQEALFCGDAGLPPGSIEQNSEYASIFCRSTGMTLQIRSPNAGAPKSSGWWAWCCGCAG